MAGSNAPKLEAYIGSHGKDSKVLIDGHEITGTIQRIAVDCSYRSMTRVEITALKLNGAPIEVVGYLVAEPPALPRQLQDAIDAAIQAYTEDAGSPNYQQALNMLLVMAGVRDAADVDLGMRDITALGASTETWIPERA